MSNALAKLEELEIQLIEQNHVLLEQYRLAFRLFSNEDYILSCRSRITDGKHNIRIIYETPNDKRFEVIVLPYNILKRLIGDNPSEFNLISRIQFTTLFEFIVTPVDWLN